MNRYTLSAVLVFLLVARASAFQDRPATGPALLLPADTAAWVSVRPLLQWTGSPGAMKYLVQVAVDTTFAEPVYADSTVADTTLRPARPLANDSAYFWRIGVVDSSRTVVFTSPRSFRTGVPASLTVDSAAFPATRVGDSSVVFVVVRNRMPVALLVDSVATPSGCYVFLDGGSFVLPPSDSLVCSVLFRPTRFGRFAEPLVLHTEQGPAHLRVDGDSPPPVLVVAARSLDFGVASVTDTVVRTVVLRNSGRVNRLSYAVRCRRYSPYQILRGTRGTIAPGESVAVRVRFHVQSYLPNAYGFHADTLFVESDGGLAALPLAGDSPPPRFRCSTVGLNFPEVAVADTARQATRIWNSSVNMLRIDSIRTRTALFTCKPGKLLIRRGDTTTATVRFFPDRPGSYADTILIFNNSWLSPFRIPVEGYAPPPMLEVDKEQQDFGQVLVGDRALFRLTITSRSVSPLGIDIASTRTRTFTVEGWHGPVRLRFGDTLGVNVWFSPDSLRQYQDTLVLVNNSLRSPARIPLSGTGARTLNTGVRVEPTFELYQNFPNPFNGETTFRYVLPTRCTVDLEVFNTLGERIETIYSGEQAEGFHNMTWAPRLATGVYYYRLRAMPEGRPDLAVSATRKMVITR